MAAVIIGDSQTKYLHRYVSDFNIPTLSYSGYRIEDLALNDTINLAFSQFEVRQNKFPKGFIIKILYKKLFDGIDPTSP